MSTGRERFLNDPIIQKIKMDSMTKADKAWAALPVGFRRFLCKQAGIAVEKGEGALSAFSIPERDNLYQANKVLTTYATAARDPLIAACINQPRPRAERFRL